MKSGTKDKIPTITLYTEDHLEEIRLFWHSSSTAHTTMLGFDKTYNLGELQVVRSPPILIICNYLTTEIWFRSFI